MSEPCQSSACNSLKSEPLDDDSPVSHRRTETTLVKNTGHNYEFVSVLDKIYQDSSHNRQEGCSSEISEGAPEKTWCPACMKLKRITVRYIAPEVSVWRRIFCNDCFRTQECEALYCCVACKLVITKVKYIAKNNEWSNYFCLSYWA